MKKYFLILTMEFLGLFVGVGTAWANIVTTKNKSKNDTFLIVLKFEFIP